MPCFLKNAFSQMRYSILPKYILLYALFPRIPSGHSGFIPCTYFESGKKQNLVHFNNRMEIPAWIQAGDIAVEKIPSVILLTTNIIALYYQYQSM